MDSKSRLIKEYNHEKELLRTLRAWQYRSIECPECNEKYLPCEDYLCKNCREKSSQSESHLSVL